MTSPSVEIFIDDVMLGSSVWMYACVIGNAIGPRLKNGWPNA